MKTTVEEIVEDDYTLTVELNKYELQTIIDALFDYAEEEKYFSVAHSEETQQVLEDLLRDLKGKVDL